MAIKKNDFVEIEYTGKLKDDGFVFDTTHESVAKEHNIFSEKTKYGPVVVCVGEGHVVKGIDSFMEGKEAGSFTVELAPDDAFGKKNPKLMQLIPTKKFLEQKIRPAPGLQINIDGTIGTVKSVSGGRTIVDFNHPLSGKEVVYELKINRIVEDKKAQVESLLNISGFDDAKVTVANNEVEIELKKKVPPQLTDAFSKKIVELTGLNKAKFVSTPEQ